MSTMTDYLEDSILDHILTGTTSPWTAPTTIYMGLSTATTPGETGGPGTEPTGSAGYSRQAVTFAAASSGTSQNSATVTFTATGGNWGTIKSYFLADGSATTATDSLYYQNLASDNWITMNDGDSLQFATDNVTVTQG